MATICLKLFTVFRPDLAFYGQKDAQQVEVLRRMVADLHLELELVVVPTVRDADGLALSRATHDSPSGASEGPCLTSRTRSRRAIPRRRARSSRPPGSRSTTSPSPCSTRPTLASAVRVGPARLIDNVPLEEAT